MSTPAAVIESANALPPLLNTATRLRTRALATSTASARANLGSLLTDAEKGHFVSIQADGGKIYFALNNADAGSIDQAAVDATNPTQQCGFVADGEVKSFRIVKGYVWLIHKAATGTPTLRVWVSSFTDQDQVA
jgi:hypothetical protein